MSDLDYYDDPHERFLAAEVERLQEALDAAVKRADELRDENDELRAIRRMDTDRDFYLTVWREREEALVERDALRARMNGAVVLLLGFCVETPQGWQGPPQIIEFLGLPADPDYPPTFDYPDGEADQ